MTPAQLQSRLRFMARELTTESQSWPRSSDGRKRLSRAAAQLAAAARECRPGVTERSVRGGEALLAAATDLLVRTASSRVDNLGGRA
jgi:hypothetical protein